MNRCGSEPTITAPGKLILMGEYAVLEGGPAVVVSVDRYVKLTPTDDGPQPEVATGLVAFARAAAAASWGLKPPARAWTADSSDLTRGGVKLGLGSSAAVAVCAAASVLFENGMDISTPESRKRIREAARTAHDSFQGHAGSGLDIAASVYGGYLSMHRSDGGVSSAVEPWSPPRGIEFRFAWTRRAASSTDLVTRVREFGQADPQLYETIIGRMSKTADGFVSGSPAWQDALSAFTEYAALMTELGRASGAPIVDDAMESVFTAARESGGSAKPSGAGGGDIVVAVFPEGRDTSGFEKRVRQLGMTPMEFGHSLRGVVGGRPDE